MKTNIIIFVVGAFALGVATGFYASHRSQLVFGDTPLLAATLAAETSINVACLRDLRAGNTAGVVLVLEDQADGDLVLLADRLSALPASARDPQYLKVIEVFRDYCNKFPHTNSVQYLRDGITQAYTLLNDLPKARP